jgi:hypothetical protein
LIDAESSAVVGTAGVSVPPVAIGIGGSGFAGGGGFSAHATNVAGAIIAAPISTDRTTSLKGERPLKDMRPEYTF